MSFQPLFHLVKSQMLRKIWKMWHLGIVGIKFSPKLLHCDWGVTRDHITLLNFHKKSGIHCCFYNMSELTMLHINQDVTNKKLSA
jgi:hypothetical protein